MAGSTFVWVAVAVWLLGGLVLCEVVDHDTEDDPSGHGVTAATQRLEDLAAGMAGMILLQVMVTYLPFFPVVVESAPIDLAAWGRIVAVAVVVALVVAAEKTVRRRLRGPGPVTAAS